MKDKEKVIVSDALGLTLSLRFIQSICFSKNFQKAPERRVRRVFVPEKQIIRIFGVSGEVQIESYGIRIPENW